MSFLITNLGPNNDFWLEDETLLQKTLRKYPENFIPSNDKDIIFSDTKRDLNTNDVKLIGILCFEGNLKINQNSIRFDTQNRIIFSIIKPSSPGEILSEIPNYKKTSIFVQAMKTTKELSLLDIAPRDVKMALRKIQKKYFRELNSSFQHLYPISLATCVFTAASHLNDPSLISAAVAIGGICMVHSCTQFFLEISAQHFYNKYLIPKEI